MQVRKFLNKSSKPKTHGPNELKMGAHTRSGIMKKYVSLDILLYHKNMPHISPSHSTRVVVLFYFLREVGYFNRYYSKDCMRKHRATRARTDARHCCLYIARSTDVEIDLGTFFSR
jgi:hypothetical protein